MKVGVPELLELFKKLSKMRKMDAPCGVDASTTVIRAHLFVVKWSSIRLPGRYHFYFTTMVSANTSSVMYEGKAN